MGWDFAFLFMEGADLAIKSPASDLFAL